MSGESDEDRWNRRYREGAYASRSHPSTYLVEQMQALGEASGYAADVACGRGRNADFLSRHGYQVDAYDISDVALSLAREHYPQASITWHKRDLLIDGLPAAASYDLVVVVRFIAEDLIRNLTQHLHPGGFVIIDEHLKWSGDEPLAGPAGDRFRMSPGVLLDWLQPLVVIDHYEGLVEEPDGQLAAVARAVARNPH